MGLRLSGACTLTGAPARREREGRQGEEGGLALFQPLMPFVLNPEHPVITEEQYTLIERLLVERISLRGICHTVCVGLQWLLQFMVARFQAAPEHLNVKPVEGAPTVILHRLEAELEELWS